MGQSGIDLDNMSGDGFEDQSGFGLVIYSGNDIGDQSGVKLEDQSGFTHNDRLLSGIEDTPGTGP